MNFLTYISNCLLFISITGCGTTDTEYPYSIDFTYINESTEVVSISGTNCGFSDDKVSMDILSGDSLLISQLSRESTNIKPSPDNIIPYPGFCQVIYGDSIKCDLSHFTNIQNYESRDISENSVIQLTYRFTDQTMKEAGECN